MHFDTRSELTKALGLQLTAAGPMRVLGNPRCKRFAMYVDNGIIKVFNVAEKGPLGEEDPAGDDFPCRCTRRRQAAENAKSHGSRLRRGAALPSNPRARWVTQGRQRPLPSNLGQNFSS